MQLWHSWELNSESPMTSCIALTLRSAFYPVQFLYGVTNLFPLHQNCFDFLPKPTIFERMWSLKSCAITQWLWLSWENKIKHLIHCIWHNNVGNVRKSASLDRFWTETLISEVSFLNTTLFQNIHLGHITYCFIE